MHLGSNLYYHQALEKKLKDVKVFAILACGDDNI
jgi:hypothetical protein